MKTIVVASENPVKLRATLSGFQAMFPGSKFKTKTKVIPSGVEHQPLSSRETYQGALNRAKGAQEASPSADFWVGIEGGVEESPEGLEAFAWVVVVSSSGLVGKSQTGRFFLPEPVADLIRVGKELGEADDFVFQQENSKQESGAIGLLTGNVVDRTRLYEHAVILALVPFKNPGLYPSDGRFD